ncbi:hypothetical protein BT96DRAFT_1082580 [Gymnopus androsaceus JB14]|uniref:Uncharacterized protein n=1 Tax=Gymnopus androsaceus JB14 TaxID=1447944 RepID=A0A6A4HV56_9AGAR|nr:hypothetical protein BT96DRAFT_1082580 [Gymnopus androsaceus JB14]
MSTADLPEEHVQVVLENLTYNFESIELENPKFRWKYARNELLSLSVIQGKICKNPRNALLAELLQYALDHPVTTVFIDEWVKNSLVKEIEVRDPSTPPEGLEKNVIGRFSPGFVVQPQSYHLFAHGLQVMQLVLHKLDILHVATFSGLQELEIMLQPSSESLSWLPNFARTHPLLKKFTFGLAINDHDWQVAGLHLVVRGSLDQLLHVAHSIFPRISVLTIQYDFPAAYRSLYAMVISSNSTTSVEVEPTMIRYAAHLAQKIPSIEAFNICEHSNIKGQARMVYGWINAHMFCSSGGRDMDGTFGILPTDPLQIAGYQPTKHATTTC